MADSCASAPSSVPALVGGLAQAAMFAFITGSPFVFISRFGVGEQAYGGLFAVIAGGLIIAAQLNRVCLGRWPPATLLGAALLFDTLAGLALMALMALAGSSQLLLLLIPLWLAIATLGFIGANATALAMTASGQRLGGGSALIGVLQFGCAFLASSLVAAGQNGTAYPMAIGVAASGTLAALLWWVSRPTTAPPTPAPAGREKRRRRNSR
jgi:MFS transporter, DHA1 family, multidrug resistance protein